MARKNKNHIRMSWGDRIFGIVNFVIVTLLMIAMVYPFYYCVILAFNDGVDATQPGIYFWPRVFTLENQQLGKNRFRNCADHSRDICLRLWYVEV